MLMNVYSKIFSTVLNKRTFLFLQISGTKFQFGGTPEVGYRDGLFTLKILFNMQKNHNLETFVTLVDLVKAYNMVNHELIIDLLKIFGPPLVLLTQLHAHTRI